MSVVTPRPVSHTPLIFKKSVGRLRYDAISRLHISTCTQSATATESLMGKSRSAALAQLFEAGL